MHTLPALAALFALAAPAPAQGVLHSLNGSPTTPRLGTALVRFHDLDGDGWREFLVGAPDLDSTSSSFGKVLVLSGRFLAEGVGAPGVSVITGPTNDFGASLAGVDDFDGNGVKDFVVGAPDFAVGTGFGFPHGMLRICDANGSTLGEITGQVTFEELGASVAVLGDLNGDGYKDILAGSPAFTGNIPNVISCGKAAVYSGKNLLASQAVVLRAHLGEKEGERFGSTLATGWFDGDSIVDYAIGTPHRESGTGVADSGRVSVYSGATGNLIRTIFGGGGAHFGASLGSGLDVTGDGVHDLVIGAPYSATNGTGSGSAYVYSGAGIVGGGLLLPLRTWHGPAVGAHFGAAVALVHDLNADGDADVLVGAPDYSFVPNAIGAGLLRCYSGATGEQMGSRTGAQGEHLGGAFVSADHWDGEPGWEFLVGSPESNLAGAATGRVSSLSIFPNTPTSYCTAKVNSLGCTPAISGVGLPSVVPGTHFNVKASNVLNNVPGILIYAYDAAATPFQGGFLCVGSPLTRTAGSFSGGTPPPAADCSGSFWFDFNSYLQTGVDAALVAGQEVFCQFWSRDVASPGGSSLSNALRFLIHA
jgi:hypothetical protein